MYKALKDNKIIAINDTGNFPCMNYDIIEEDIEHNINDYKRYGNEFILHDIEKDNEEMKQARSSAYAQEVDCLVAQYNRKKLFDLFEEGEEEALKKEIEDKVAEIKERYPYQEEE